MQPIPTQKLIVGGQELNLKGKEQNIPVSFQSGLAGFVQ